MWDVVNEALDDGTNYLRPSGWEKFYGEDLIASHARAVSLIVTNRRVAGQSRLLGK